jgi:hypothetical protein
MDTSDQDHFDPSLLDRDLPHIWGRSMEEVQQALKSTMSPYPSEQDGYASQDTSQSMDLYDQDHYSIPDDDLQSVTSSTGNINDHVTTPEATKTSDWAEIHLHQFDPRMVDRAHFTLQGSTIEAIQETKGQPKDDAYLSDSSNSSHECRVPLTTLATDEDFKYNESTSEDTFQDVGPKPRQLLQSLKKPRVSFKIATGHTSESSPSIKVSSSNKDPLSKTVTNSGISNPITDKKPFSLALPTELKSPEATSTIFTRIGLN